MAVWRTLPHSRAHVSRRNSMSKPKVSGEVKKLVDAASKRTFEVSWNRLAVGNGTRRGISTSLAQGKETGRADVQTEHKDTGDYLFPRNKATEDPSNRVKHTKMLPIYCSFMGLIIFSLILYVIYKLWKQHDSVSKNKLTDIYSIEENRCGSADKFVPARQPDSRLSGDQAHRDNTASSSGSSQRGEGEDLGGRERIAYRENTGEEYGQLLGPGQPHSSTMYNATEALNSLPVHTLGELCYQLSMKGWRKVAAAFGATEILRQDESSSNSCSSLKRAAVLAQSAAQSRAGTESTRPQDGELLQTVRVIHELCSRSKSVTVMDFAAVLRQANRADLVRMVCDDSHRLTTNQEFANSGTLGRAS